LSTLFTSLYAPFFEPWTAHPERRAPLNIIKPSPETLKPKFYTLNPKP